MKSPGPETNGLLLFKLHENRSSSRSDLCLLQQAWVSGSICHLLPEPVSPQSRQWAPNLAQTAWGSVVELERWDMALSFEMGGEIPAVRARVKPAQERVEVAAPARSSF